MRVAQLVLVGVVGAVAGLMGYVSMHFVGRFRARRHPLSIVAALLPVGWVVAAALALHPGLSDWRPLVFTVALGEAVLSALIVWAARRQERRLEGR